MTKSKALTPAELHAHVANIMSSQEPVPSGNNLIGGVQETEPLSSVLNKAKQSTLARNNCLQITSTVHPFMPDGSKIVHLVHNTALIGGNHLLHHVPTTEGPYVVDFTHRQFDDNAPHPLVESLSDFNLRQAGQQYSYSRTLSPKAAANWAKRTN